MRARSRHFADGGVHGRKKGRGFITVALLRRAKEIAGDPRFGLCAVDALRQAAVILDAGDDVQMAAFVLLQVRPQERMIRKIQTEAELHRPAFRKRMVRDFESAIDQLIEAAKPTPRAELARRAGAEATNWAGLSKADKDRNWAATFEKAVDAEDKRRVVANSLALTRKLYPDTASEPEPLVTLS